MLRGGCSSNEGRLEQPPATAATSARRARAARRRRRSVTRPDERGLSRHGWRRASHDVLVERSRGGGRGARPWCSTRSAPSGGSRLAENAAGLAWPARRADGHPVGHGRAAEPMLAALANATAGVSLEVDEGNRWGGATPRSTCCRGARDRRGARRRRRPAHREPGGRLRGTSRLGGATQSAPTSTRTARGNAGRRGGRGPAAPPRRRRLRTVISLAASMSPANSWTPCFEGATIRNLYPGRAALQGILAAHSLGCGFTALPDAPSRRIRHDLGERFDGRAVEESAGRAVERYRIERNYVKLHACCLYNHPALDALRRCAPPEPSAPTRRADRGHLDAVRDAHGRPRAREHARAKFSVP